MKPKSVLYPLIRKIIMNRLTVTGRFLLITGIICLLLGSYTTIPTFVLYILAFFYFFVFVLSPIFAGLLLPRLELGMKTPGRTSAGSTVYEEITLSNQSNRDAHFVFVTEENLPDEIIAPVREGIMVPFLQKGEEVHFRVELFMKKRGEYLLKSMRMESPFPLGIFKSGYSFHRERSILVYPDFKPLDSFNIPVGWKLQPGGIALASNIGESSEFLGTREFRTGDDPRYIHWTSWARLNKPIIKEFHQEFYCRIAVMIDTFVPENSPNEAYDAFESSLSLAASLADYLERQEYIIDIVAAGPEIFYLQAGRSLAYLDQILDILACLDVCREKPYAKMAPHLMEELSCISTVIVLLLGLDDERQDFLQKLKDLGVEMRIFLILDHGKNFDSGEIESLFGRVTVLSSDEIKRGFDAI